MKKEITKPTIISNIQSNPFEDENKETNDIFSSNNNENIFDSNENKNIKSNINTKINKTISQNNNNNPIKNKKKISVNNNNEDKINKKIPKSKTEININDHDPFASHSKRKNNNLFSEFENDADDDIFSKKDGIENIFESNDDNKNKESSIFD